MIVIDDEAWLFGGKNDARAIVDSTVWKYTFSNNQWETVTTTLTPEGRYGHSLIAIGNKFYMYGGKKDDDNVYRDLWEFDTTDGDGEWNQLSTSASPGRRYHHVTVTNGTDKFWITGGLHIDGTETESDDLWEYDINDEKWDQKDDGPTIIKAAAILEEDRDDIELFIFGGEEDGDIKGSTWKYDSTDDESDDDDDDDDDGGSHSISCGATGLEIFIFLSILFLIKIYRTNKNYDF